MFIGIDIGGTSTRVALFHTLDAADFTLIAHFPTLPEYEQQLRSLFGIVHEHEVQALAGIGVSIGGRLAKDGRSVAVAPNLPSYINKPFAQDLEQHWLCPVRLAHDTVCGLLVEQKFGVLHNSMRCAYLTLSTGTGAAIHLCKGTHSLTVSIEIGHQLLDGNSLLCLCGQVGCLETFTGGRQLALRLGHTLAQITDSAFWTLFCDKLSLGLVNLGERTAGQRPTASTPPALDASRPGDLGVPAEAH